MTIVNNMATQARRAALLGAIALLMGCHSEDRRVVPEHTASTAHVTPVTAPAWPAGSRLVTTYAFNALVVPVLDDADPPRFADIGQPTICGEESRVRVDGTPVEPGTLVPAGAFTLQWDLHAYCPFGQHGPLLDGRVDVLVFRDDDRGMDIIVQPRSFFVSQPARGVP